MQAFVDCLGLGEALPGNVLFAGKLFGVGTYFSPNASKADLYTRPNDFSTRAAGHLPITAVALHIGLPSLPLMAARLAQPPTVGLPAAPPPLPGIPTRTGGVGRPGAAGDPTTNKFAGNLRFGRGSWLGGGRNNTNSTLTSPASSNPSLLQRDGTAKRDKEKGGLRAVCAKLARQGGGSNGNRPKDSLVPASQPANSQKGSTSQQANTQQHPKTHDSTGSRTQQASATGTFGSSANFMAAPSPRCLLLARVCLGEVYKAMYPMPDARMPPNKPDPVAAKLAYDSGKPKRKPSGRHECTENICQTLPLCRASTPKQMADSEVAFPQDCLVYAHLELRVRLD